jgi:6-phosphogluconolactonase
MKPLLLALSLVASSRAAVLFVGTYTNTNSRGIYALPFDLETGRMGEPVLAAAAANPSFLAIGPDHKALYAVDESLRGKVSAFSIERDAATASDGSPSVPRLAPLGSQSTGGNGPAHLAVDPAGRVLIAANYGGGSVASFPIGADGRLGPASSVVMHHGKLGPDSARQKASHPHSVTFSRDGRFGFVCDLGMDAVMIYRVDAASGTIAPGEPANAAVPPGAGARHSVFSPDGRWLYVLNEMGGSVCVFGWDEAETRLELRQTISALPEGYPGPASSAEICLSPDGRFVYASNRGPNDITVFARDQRTGTLQPVDRRSCGGKGPRNFVISPNGRWLICANEQSNSLVVFKIDPTTGKLGLTDHAAQVSRPVCVVFADR